MKMKCKIFVLIILLLFCTTILFGQENVLPEIRYKLDFIYEYFLIGENEYPLAPLNPAEDVELLKILSGFEDSKFLAEEYTRDIGVSRSLLNCAAPVVLTGGIMSTYQMYNNDTPESLLTAGLIMVAAGGITNLIGTIYLQNAKSHIFDAVWEYNQNIRK